MILNIFPFLSVLSILYIFCYIFINIHRDIHRRLYSQSENLICGGLLLPDLRFRHVAVDRNFLLPLRLHSSNIILSLSLLLYSYTYGADPC